MRVKDYKLVATYLLILAFIVSACLWVKKLTEIYEIQKMSITTEYNVHPTIESDISDWVMYAKAYGIWNDTLKKRLDALDVIMLPHNKMYKFGEDYSGHPIRAVGVTIFDAKDGEVLPNRIILSEQILSNSYLRALTVYHEMGHAVLLQNDITEDYNSQIMWHTTHNSYCDFENIDYMYIKIMEQFTTPQDDDMINSIIENEKPFLLMCGDGICNNKYNIKVESKCKE